MAPDDGIRAGSGPSPRTVPAVRQGAAAARELLIEFACKSWAVERDKVAVRDGKAIQAGEQSPLTYADLAGSEDAARALDQPIPSDVSITPVKEWKVLGALLLRPNGHDI